MPVSSIDTSDNPPTKGMAGGVRGAFFRPVNMPLSLRDYVERGLAASASPTARPRASAAGPASNRRSASYRASASG
jgi:hypothetical protein